MFPLVAVVRSQRILSYSITYTIRIALKRKCMKLQLEQLSIQHFKAIMLLYSRMVRQEQEKHLPCAFIYQH